MPADQGIGFGRRRLPVAFVSPLTLTITQSCVPW